MLKPLFTSLSPNAQSDDIWLAFKLLWMPWRWRNGQALDELNNKFVQFLSVPNIFFFESGRSCLYALLKSLELKQEDEVLLQAYTCVAVPEPVLWIGAKPIYVDCDESLTMSIDDLKKKITPRSKVLIIQHTFGQPANLDKLMDIARKHKLYVIEDCAHALGASYDGKKVGSFGDASFFSFGREKVVSAIFGGVLAIKDKKLAEKAAQFHQQCKEASFVWILQQLLHPIITGLAKITYRIYLGKVLLKVAQKLGILSKAVYPEERRGEKPPFIFRQMPNALAKLALHQLAKLDLFNAHRRQRAKQYTKALQDLPLRLMRGVDKSDSIFLRFTIRTDKAEKLRKAAKLEQIYLGDWYTTAIAPFDVNYSKIDYNPKGCPTAEILAKETVNLPTDIHISEQDAERIIQMVRNFFSQKC